MDKPTIGSLSVDARLLYERLIEVPIGGEVEYTELNALIKRDVQNAARPVLYSARKMAQRDKGMVFGVVHGRGLKRLDDSGIVGTSDGTLAKIRRTARRGARTLACVNDYAKLPEEDKLRHNATMAIFGVVETTAREQNVKRIASNLASKGVPPLADVMQRTLEAFKGEGEKK